MPEVATEMFKWSDGKMWDDFSAQGPDDDRVWASLQTSLTRVQMAIEDSIVHMAHRSLSKRRKGPNPPSGAVVLLDRGVIDNVAYCTDEAWAMVLEDLGTTTARLRDSRYDHVIHLVTAAHGAEQHYTLEQAGSEESARGETAEQARLLDGRTLRAWQETKSHFIVGNAGVTWPQKRERAKAVLGLLLGDAASGGHVQKLQCAYLPQAILAEAAADDETPWAVSDRPSRQLAQGPLPVAGWSPRPGARQRPQRPTCVSRSTTRGSPRPSTTDRTSPQNREEAPGKSETAPYAAPFPRLAWSASSSAGADGTGRSAEPVAGC